MKPMTLPELPQEYILTHDLRPDSSHLRTIYGYAIEHGLLDLVVNPLKRRV